MTGALEPPPRQDLKRGDRLAGRVAIVTGAGSEGPLPGTGTATAQIFAAQGAKVVVFDQSSERATTTLSAIVANGGEALVVAGDVTSADDCGRAVDSARSRWGRLDIVVNNAAVVTRGRQDEFNEPDWDRVLAVNLKGAMIMADAAIGALAASGGGAIINISSIAALRGLGSPAYAASKAGLVGLTHDLAYSLGRRQIRVNCIAPGHLHTPMGSSTDEYRELRRRAGVLGTEGLAWEVAWACVFLASEEARWITSVVLPVDAGTIGTTAVAMHPFMTQ